MNNVVEVPLGSEGLEYVMHCLAQGAGLCAIASEIVLSNGRAVAYVPPGTSHERAMQFDVGGLMSTSESDACISGYIVNEMLNNNKLCIIQNVWRDYFPAREAPSVDVILTSSGNSYCILAPPNNTQPNRRRAEGI